MDYRSIEQIERDNKDFNSIKKYEDFLNKNRNIDKEFIGNLQEMNCNLEWFGKKFLNIQLELKNISHSLNIIADNFKQQTDEEV